MRGMNLSFLFLEHKYIYNEQAICDLQQTKFFCAFQKGKCNE